MQRQRKPDIRMELEGIEKVVRSNIRLKHSLEADREVNEKIPEVLRRAEVAIRKGKAFELDIKSVLES